MFGALNAWSLWNVTMIRSQRSGRMSRASRKTVSERPSDKPDELPKPRKLYNGPGAIVCPNCGASVKATARGYPVSHSPGGHGTSIERGLYPCPNTGDQAGRRIRDVEWKGK